MVPGLNVNAQEYTDAMILSGSKVEFYKKMDADLEKIVVGPVSYTHLDVYKRQVVR